MHQGALESHNTELRTKLLKTIEDVGPYRFSAVCSDNTNVTKAARKELNRCYPWILPIWDCIHVLHSLIGDITAIPVFKAMADVMKPLLGYFSKSSHATNQLRELRNASTERTGELQKIGKTRFGTHWSAAVALQPCLSHIRTLVQNGTIKFGKVSATKC